MKPRIEINAVMTAQKAPVLPSMLDGPMVAVRYEYAFDFDLANSMIAAVPDAASRLYRLLDQRKAQAVLLAQKNSTLSA